MTLISFTGLSVSRARVVLSLSLVLPGAAPPSIVARATASRNNVLVFYFHMVAIPVKVYGVELRLYMFLNKQKQPSS
jgi:hypothetical protein